MSDVYKTAIVALMTGAFATAGTLYVSTFDYFNRSRELDIKMVDVSLAILRGEKGDGEQKQSKMARTFALRALRQYSKVELSNKELDLWALSGEKLLLEGLPISPTNSYHGAWGYRGYDATTIVEIREDTIKDIDRAVDSLKSGYLVMQYNVKRCASRKAVFKNGEFLMCYKEPSINPDAK